MVTTRYPAGLVEQPDGGTVVPPGPFGPRQRAQRQGQRLGLARPSGLSDNCLGGRAERIWVRRHIVMCLPGAYHEVARRLCTSQETAQPICQTTGQGGGHVLASYEKDG